MKLKQDLGKIVISVAIGAASVLYPTNSNSGEGICYRINSMVNSENALPHLRNLLTGRNPKTLHEKSVKRSIESLYEFHKRNVQNVQVLMSKDIGQITEEYQRLISEAERALNYSKDGNFAEVAKTLKTHSEQTVSLAKRFECYPAERRFPGDEELIGKIKGYEAILESIR